MWQAGIAGQYRSPARTSHLRLDHPSTSAGSGPATPGRRLFRLAGRLGQDFHRLERGLYASRSQSDLPSRLGLLPREGSEPARWFEFEPTYVLHWANAYEDGDEVVVDGFFQGCPEPKGVPEQGPPDRMFRFLGNDVLETRLHRWRINLVTGVAKEEDLSDRFSEFGMINGRHRGRPYRHVYAIVNEPGWFVMRGPLHHDTATGEVEGYMFPDGVFCSETAMAPRTGSRPPGRAAGTGPTGNW